MWYFYEYIKWILEKHNKFKRDKCVHIKYTNFKGGKYVYDSYIWYQWNKYVSSSNSGYTAKNDYVAPIMVIEDIQSVLVPTLAIMEKIV